MRLKTLAAAACITLAASTAFAATLPMPTLQVDASGQLTGAQNVTVNGALFDVEFFGGSCASLFSGCDEVSDFTFQTEAAAFAAAQALLDQVFIDTSAGSYDSDPTLTAGCIDPALCTFSTPYRVADDRRYDGVAAINFAQGLNVVDRTAAQLFLASTALVAVDSNFKFARWSAADTPTIAPVPLPAGGVLLL